MRVSCRAWVAVLLVMGAVPLFAEGESTDAAGGVAVPAEPLSLESLAITVTEDHPREFIYTDKGSAHLSGEAVGADSRSYHGFYVAMHELLDGWVLRLEDGVEIGPATATSARVRPDCLVRRHELPGGEVITETVTLFDRSNGFRVVYDDVPPGRFELIPRVDMRFLWRVGKPSYAVQWQDGVLCLARQDRPVSSGDEHPAWLAIAVTGAQGFNEIGRHVDTIYSKDAARQAMAQASPYLPGAITGAIPARIPSGRIEVVFAADHTAEAAAARARRLRGEAIQLTQARQQRLEDLLLHGLIRTGIEREDRAFAWARISLDNLIMEQRGIGIYAGFYWFTTYWGRDSFIVLPGACLVNGDFDTAETILRSFAAYQDRDPDSAREGRLPNFVTVEQVQFAGIDGTWWFVRALDKLWKRSGRDAFAKEMAPAVIRAVEGALRHAVDEHGFLTHGDGETWMDAGGEANPYSPRGDRAVEVQALFHRGLLTAARLAERFGAIDGAPAGLSGAELAERYREQAEKLAVNFHEMFWRDKQLVDHLNSDGSQDLQVRPNGLLALMASPELFANRQQVTDVLQEVAPLVKPWGVQSLGQDDPAFHPKHLDLGNYYYDEAYHNGDIWLWLSGPYVSAAVRNGGGERAFGQTRMLLDEILDEGAVGSLQEIRDGAQAASNDEFGGATSQAWSLSELLRNITDDYLGLKVDLTAEPPRIAIDPAVPAAWPGLTVRTRIGEYDCMINYERRSGPDREGEALEIWFDDCIPEDWIISLGGRFDSANCNTAAECDSGRNGDWPWRYGIAYDIP